MATKVYDAVVTQFYKDGNGEEKKKYISVGAVFQGNKGLSMKLDSIPVGFNGWISFYEPKAKDEKPAKGRSAEQEPNDELPPF